MAAAGWVLLLPDALIVGGLLIAVFGDTSTLEIVGTTLFVAGLVLLGVSGYLLRQRYRCTACGLEYPPAAQR